MRLCHTDMSNRIGGTGVRTREAIRGTPAKRWNVAFRRRTHGPTAVDRIRRDPGPVTDTATDRWWTDRFRGF